MWRGDPASGPSEGRIPHLSSCRLEGRGREGGESGEELGKWRVGGGTNIRTVEEEEEKDKLRRKSKKME